MMRLALHPDGLFRFMVSPERVVPTYLARVAREGLGNPALRPDF